MTVCQYVLQSIPRQVWLDNRTTTDLVQYPVEELSSLHGTEMSDVNVTVGAASFVKLDGIGGNQVLFPHGFHHYSLEKLIAL